MSTAEVSALSREEKWKHQASAIEQARCGTCRKQKAKDRHRDRFLTAGCFVRELRLVCSAHQSCGVDAFPANDLLRALENRMQSYAHLRDRLGIARSRQRGQLAGVT